jgi:predicted transcriptional regulator
MKYRSRVAIASKILQLARAGNATKTRLMYGSFLSFAQINEYLDFLRLNGLIVLSEETRGDALTEKGLRFLRIYDELSVLVPLDGPIPAV